jgi:hypothetical protein
LGQRCNGVQNKFFSFHVTIAVYIFVTPYIIICVFLFNMIRRTFCV